ncbi:MAG TPA: hypothetical protein VKU94_04205 [Geobacterales bacterium]|nr:hypothetical protein [Geobacterales bacterium]
MDKGTGSMLIMLLFLIQVVLTIFIYDQYPFINYDNQRIAGILIAASLFVFALILHIYDIAFKPGEDRTVEMETPG